MMITRSLAGIAFAAGILVLAPITASSANASTAGASTASASSSKWGPYYARGTKAKALGTLTAAAKDDPSLPNPLVKVTGSVVSLSRTPSTCGWAVFRFTTYDSANQPKLAYRNYRTCSYGVKKKISFSLKNVIDVELKVCSEKKAAKPSLNCEYSGTWKSLYVYYK
ncbi:hypothetical protein [Sphaerimonospora thailandensis]|uniref:Uncharacterized protein n=1 Tax=Sphaerimonospora thailandensis TaxID=795644 RepID=A0A8J3RDK1_9ACTN|nr:hypothetical protein [Sphaerimonospora thailandensis]GIH72824.1 hypothetical protein Mth01_50770 [Sphaerimonospora thailandensis]